MSIEVVSERADPKLPNCRSVRAPLRDAWDPAVNHVDRSMGCYRRRMAQSISQRELRNDSGEIMRRLDQGETFIVTRNGMPVGELAPLRRHRFVSADAAVAVFRNAPRVDPARYRADLDEVESQDIEPRA